MGKFLLGAVVVIVAVAAGLGGAALAGPRVAHYLQGRISISSRQLRIPNMNPFAAPSHPRKGQRLPGYHGISSQSPIILAPTEIYFRWNSSNSKITELSDS